MNIEIFYAVRSDDRGLPFIEEVEMVSVSSCKYLVVKKLDSRCVYNPYDRLSRWCIRNDVGVRAISYQSDRGWIFTSRELAAMRIDYMVNKLEEEANVLIEKLADYKNRNEVIKLR